MNDFTEQAMQTCSDEFHGELVPLRIFNMYMAQAIRSAELLDKVKKSLFYGKENYFAWVPDEPAMSRLEDKTTINLAHGILGVVTEAGELLEALNKSHDLVNVKEEVGDVLWYLALIAKTAGFTLEEAEKACIAKLRTRYPNKFIAYDANNRDLAKEREVLEEHGKS